MFGVCQYLEQYRFSIIGNSNCAYSNVLQNTFDRCNIDYIWFSTTGIICGARISNPSEDLSSSPVFSEFRVAYYFYILWSFLCFIVCIFVLFLLAILLSLPRFVASGCLLCWPQNTSYCHDIHRKQTCTMCLKFQIIFW